MSLPHAARLIVALDAPSLAGAVRVAHRLRGLVGTVKVGSILFTAAGPDAIRRLRALGFQVMLDLKFHDIPHTVEASCRAAARHRARWLTVHASGGRAMLEAAVRGARQGTPRGVVRPRVLAVTLLTSVAASSGSRRLVLARAGAAKAAGCDGVVVSAREARAVRRQCGRRFLIVCPGIRPAGAARGDQRRTTSPAQAVEAGADWLVVGRPVTGAASPRAAAAALLDAMRDT